MRNNRVIVIDDNPAIHADIRNILCPNGPGLPAIMRAAPANPAGGTLPPRPLADFLVDAVPSGPEGVLLVGHATDRGQPYAMAFVDIGAPPAWSGITTVGELWKIAPDLQIVVCSGHTDCSWDDTLARLGGSDRVVILKKPFDAIEVLQLANALTEKWRLLQQTRKHAAELEAAVAQRTAELQAANTALQEEIAQRIVMEVDLRRAKDTAESADRAKSAFLANMSHEIRTPMNGVIGMANLLLSTSLTAEQRDLAQTLSQSSEALLTIMNDILDFSKIEAGRLVLESVDFDLAEHLELALDLNADAAAQKGLELVLDIDPAVPRRLRGDPVRLRQIVLNLVGNAVKFTARGEVILGVTLTAVQSGKNFLRFEITDTGIGIPPAVQEKLFEPFIQADTSTTRRFGGTGLGLAICKRLAELMCGEIGVTSELEKGSTFWFTIVLRDPLTPSAAKPVPLPLEAHYALLVDDNAASLKLLDQLCTRWHLRHACASDAASALAALRQAALDRAPFDLVVLDHRMPGTDAFAVADLIRADAAVPTPTLVVLASRAERLAQPQLEAHGIAACEIKPLHPERLRCSLAGVANAAARHLNGSAVTTRAENGTSPAHNGHAFILVAEDNPVNQKVTLLQLRNLGYSADLATNGREALEAVRRKRYALVLMDAQMPEMDGIEATRRIRAAQAASDPHIPAQLRIVAMTANAMAGDRETCIDAGMDDYVAKPVKPDALRDILTRYLPHEKIAGGERLPQPAASQT